ncbi:putative secreted RxLR effector protein [Phytophthora cinnamomi]|uniref:putative secreted RxLR effector protein n=1 Tax=Phytophthora cinnamomi TaxID=4785 RepID=UPI0035594304|nr:putative secreted RxLR effector protein [Phytophthora cinnamomi]
MDPRYVVVALVILLASASASIASTETKALDGRLLEVNPNGARTTRLLRPTNEDEERALPGLDNLKAAVKMKTWLVKKKSGADILAKLKLNEKVEDALASPKLATLDKYLNLLRNKNSASDASLLGTLTAHYGEGVVAAALASAKKVPDTKLTATKLQTQQLEGWLSSGKTADDVFGILKINKKVEDALASPKLATLDEYLNLLRKKYPASDASLLGTLTAHYGEGVVAAALVSAKKVPGTELTATKLQTQQLEGWLNSGKTAGDVLDPE